MEYAKEKSGYKYAGTSRQMISFMLLSAFRTWHRVRFSRRTADSYSGHVISGGARGCGFSVI